MFNIVKREINWGGRKLTLETGKIARQSDGAVIATYGETSVLATVVGARTVNPDVDFFPLTVHYQEKTFAAGKIPGGFFKREGRPSEKEVLVSRLIDRPIRPLFAEGFKNEVQVICTLLGHDMENEADVLSMIAASAALTFSGIPFMGPIGAAKVGYIDGNYILNPTLADLEKSQLDLVVAGTSEGVMMVESEAKELSEDIMLNAVMFGHKEYQTIIEAIIEMAEECAKDPWELPQPSETRAQLSERVKALTEADLRKAYKEVQKQKRAQKIADIKQKALEKLTEEGLDVKHFDEVAKDLEKDIVRTKALKDGSRIDGRDTKTIRPIEVEVGLLKKAHGSSLFTRGETQALVAATLGTDQDEQIIDAIAGEYRESFMLHYNFPPFSVGEVGRLGSPGRREVGHGKLAWRAIHPLLPEKDKFPYTIRIVSEITESNGSSSMATVCGTSLSLMDAGIPLPRAVAGVAMGLIKEGKDFVVLSDIMGDEDHLGDMDFKVAGTDQGITALQMDIKIPSITEEIMKIALEQAHEGRLHVLSVMNKVIDQPRTQLSESVPQMLSMVINKDKIRDVIGSGGRVIREICDSTGAKIDIEQDGTVKIAGPDAKAVQNAMTWIQSIVSDPEPGKIYEGVVVKIVDFGAFVRFFGVREGLVHISEISPDTRPEKVTDFLQEGDRVKVKFLGCDPRGKIKLSIKAALVAGSSSSEISEAS